MWLEHPRRDRGDTGIGRAAALGVRPAGQVITIGLTNHCSREHGGVRMRRTPSDPNATTTVEAHTAYRAKPGRSKDWLKVKNPGRAGRTSG